jgi:hypothetical protein
MTRFEDLVAAYGRREHDGYMELEEHQQCAERLFRGIEQIAEVPVDAMHSVPLDPANAPHPHSHMGGVGDWFQITFRFVFESPNTRLPVILGIRLSLRRERDRWAVKLHETAKPYRFKVRDPGEEAAACEGLLDEIIEWLNARPEIGTMAEGRHIEIGFHKY